MKSFAIGGVDFAVEKKKIKNMYVRVYPPDGRVAITAPRAVSDEAIRAFAASRLPWIEKQREKLARHPAPEAQAYVSGETHFLWGEPYCLELRRGTHNDVALDGDALILTMRGESTAAQREKAMEAWYRARLEEAIPAVLARCESIVGVAAASWRIRNMKSRWGSCTIPKRCICLNLQLVKKPPECLEYVVIHELVHLLERGHNAVFHAYMDRFYPAWRLVKGRLNGR